MHHACFNGHLEVVEMLWDRGADVNALTNVTLFSFSLLPIAKHVDFRTHVDVPSVRGLLVKHITDGLASSSNCRTALGAAVRVERTRDGAAFPRTRNRFRAHGLTFAHTDLLSRTRTYFRAHGRALSVVVGPSSRCADGGDGAAPRVQGERAGRDQHAAHRGLQQGGQDPGAG
eukprot:1177474-Prorocentrum_minimum.AAC.2